MGHADEKTSEKETRLETHIQARLGSRVRHVRVVCRNHGVILQGSAHTYYAKQLAQQSVMEVTDLPILANEIDVS
jgi:osmotically-inducible protein OsmY